MALFMQPSISSTKKWSIKKIPLAKTVWVTSMSIGLLSLSACQTAPMLTSGSASTTASATSTGSQSSVVNDGGYANGAYTDDGYEADFPIESYIPPEPVADPDTSPKIVTQQAPITSSKPVITTPSRNDYNTRPPAPPSRNELLERARQNSQQPSRSTTANNSNLPVFQNLMQSGIDQLKAGNLTAAESSFTRAQRLAPKSTAVYFYLSQVALKKNQPRKAEAMARRGLSVSTDKGRNRALWQLILRSGQMQNNQRVIKEAQQALR